MPESSLVSPGQGITRLSVLGDEPAVEEDAPTTESQELPDDSGNTVWSDRPTFSDQLWRYPETCRMGPPVTAVFKLKDAQDVEKLNNLMARTVPESAPDIVVLPQQGNTVWSEEECTFVELVKYRKVQYKRLIKKQ